MRNGKQLGLLIIRIAADLSAVALGWVGAYFLRFYSVLSVEGPVPPQSLYFKLIPFIVIIWGLIFSLNGFYIRSLRRRSAFVEALDIFQSHFLAILTFIAFTYFYEEYRYSRITMIIFAALVPFLVISVRSLIRKLLRRYRRYRPTRQILVIGAGEIGIRGLDYRLDSEIDTSLVVGAIAVGRGKDSETFIDQAQLRKVPTLDLPKDWADFFSRQSIHSVVFAVPGPIFPEVESQIARISEQVADVSIIPDIAKYARLGAGIDLIDGTPVIRIHASPLEGWGSIVKRLFDLIASSMGLIALAPLMLLFALLVKMSSRGPVFYRQQRMGLDGEIFDCLKFRSMPVDVESKSGPVWAKSGENRATPIGQFMRKFSIDELPQLINVWRGDMSLVGPRPERPVFVQNFRSQVPGYMLRHKAKAGITGWAQVNGWRGNTSIEKRIECDLYYIQNWSMWLDIKILLMTVNEVFNSRNAY